MKKYNNSDKVELQEVVCNKCGRSLKVERGILKEGCFHGDFTFGYFSSRDGMRHQFDLCESCYDEITAEFALPVEESPEQELL